MRKHWEDPRGIGGEGEALHWSDCCGGRTGWANCVFSLPSLGAGRRGIPCRILPPFLCSWRIIFFNVIISHLFCFTLSATALSLSLLFVSLPMFILYWGSAVKWNTFHIYIQIPFIDKRFRATNHSVNAISMCQKADT